MAEVVKGEVKDLPRRPGLSTVAIKMLKEGHTDSEMIDLVSEMTMMKILDSMSTSLISWGSPREMDPYMSLWNMQSTAI
ncbi:Receptor protein-tyrosine kinase [Caligus rogercresseyi]|uniref:Receptor protein-tyrosine kinase n=1 Tax=Caligus rogercresseyi TaxID=217165 RepID=A0A7T8JXU4_CALRO|nr:Receptor protein-tyrosine kinase [Caligus rogercresseyi]